MNSAMGECNTDCPDTAKSCRGRVIVLALLTLCTLSLYWPVQHYPFLNFDDQIYVTDNVHVRAGVTAETLRWALTSLDAGFWHPLTWLSLMADASIYHMNAGGYHWTNVLLHLGSTLILFLAMNRMTGALWRSGFVAALFAFHPLHVEPVAWIAERKEVLCGFFWMLTLWTYARYAEKPGPGRYLAVLASFILGLMSKPMIATLPIVLLILDYWPLERLNGDGARRKESWRRLIGEKIPLLVCSAVIVGLTFVTEHRFGALTDMGAISLSDRISNALVSYAIYIGQTIVPMNLAVYYPHPGSLPLGLSAGAGFFLAAVSAVALYRIKHEKYLFAGWCWYLISLVPVIGLVQLGSMARADRYTYIPLTGLFIVLAWGGPALLKESVHKRRVLLCGAAVIVAAFMVCASSQLSYWQNDRTLFQHAAEVTTGNYKAYHVLGMVYHGQGDDAKALAYLKQSLRLRPDYRAFNDLGILYMGQGRYGEAEKAFERALELKPQYAKTLNNLGSALACQGKNDAAIDFFRKALQIDPAYKGAQKNLDQAIQSRPSTKQRPGSDQP